jgi:outer membrane autotransporter protein
VDGYGAVQDAFNHAWYLTEWGNAPDPTFSLVQGDSPNALQTPGILTGAQNIYYDASGVVSDHVYGSHFPLGGSGGADLPVDTASGGGGSNNKTGLWAKITGNWDDQDTTVNDSTLPVSIDTGFSQNTYSVLGGADFSPSGEANGLRAGLFGGYVSSNLDFTSYGASADYKGGVVGGYAAYTSGGFYVDTEVSANFLSIDYQAPAIGIGNTANVNGTTVGVIANTGYRFQNTWGFIEPIASLTYANTSIDNASGGGSTVDFSNGQSFRAGAGGRVGTTFGTPGGTRTEVAVLGKVWDEFEDANEVTITNNTSGDSATYSNGISGVFGELSLTATTWTPGRAWSGFATGGAKFSDAFTDWNAQLGVRRNF